MLFQKRTVVYCLWAHSPLNPTIAPVSVLQIAAKRTKSLIECGCKINTTRMCKINKTRMSQPNMGSIFHIKNQWNILVIGNYYVNYQNEMLLTSSYTKLTLMHLFLFTNSDQKELVSIYIYIRRVYATAINFPCIKTLLYFKFFHETLFTVEWKGAQCPVFYPSYI